MVRSVSGFQSKYGQIFKTEKEAKNHELYCDLVKNLRDLTNNSSIAYGGHENRIHNFIIEYRNEIFDLLKDYYEWEF